MLLTPGELADATGFTLEAIIRYEAIGFIRSVPVQDVRRYGEDAKLRLELLRKGKRLGFTVEEIMRLVENRSFHNGVSRKATQDDELKDSQDQHDASTRDQRAPTA